MASGARCLGRGAVGLLCVLTLLLWSASGKCVYIAEDGDTADVLAARQACSAAEIEEVNSGADFDPLVPGQLLFLPETCTCPPPKPCNVTMTGQDSAFQIAIDRGCMLMDIAGANPGIDLEALNAGDVLAIPTDRCRCEANVVGCVYTVLKGEYLLVIAAKLKCESETAIDDIVAVNPGLNPDFILVGQTLVIPPSCRCPGSEGLFPAAAPAPIEAQPVPGPSPMADPPIAGTAVPAPLAGDENRTVTVEDGAQEKRGDGTHWAIIGAGVASIAILGTGAAIVAVLLWRRRDAQRKQAPDGERPGEAPIEEDSKAVHGQTGVPSDRARGSGRPARGHTRDDLLVIATQPSARNRDTDREPLTMQSQSDPSASDNDSRTRTCTRTRTRTAGSWTTGPPVSGSSAVQMTWITDETGGSSSEPRRGGCSRAVRSTVDGMRIITLPAASQRSYNESIEYLQDVLDGLHRQNVLLADRWQILSPNERRIGGQGLVQFIWDTRTRQDHVAKFFLSDRIFEREAQLYARPQVRDMMAAVVHMQKAGHCTPAGNRLPSFIVLKRGSSLDEWALKRQPDFPTSLQVLMQIVGRLAALHAAGLVHRDLKPANILWRTDDGDWTIIDFGCVADLSEGDTAHLACSLPYAAPEIAEAVEAGAKSIIVDTACDIWSLGIVVYELLTRERVFPRSQARQAVLAQLLGRELLPWEEGAPEERRRKVRRLGVLRRPVLSCLSRDPAQRPSASSLLSALNSLFQATQSKTYD